MLKWHYIRGLQKRGEKWEGWGPLDMWRASIPGGWLVMVETAPTDTHGFAPTFVPDPEHKWDGTSTDYDRKVDG